MHTTYHLASAQDVNNELLDAIKATFKSKPITIIVEEDTGDAYELTDEQKATLDSRLAEGQETYITREVSEERMKRYILESNNKNSFIFLSLNIVYIALLCIFLDFYPIKSNSYFVLDILLLIISTSFIVYFYKNLPKGVAGLFYILVAILDILISIILLQFLFFFILDHVM